MNDVDAVMTLVDEDADAMEQVRSLQALINSGTVWHMEGSMGRAAMRAIEDGVCALGKEGRRNYWGVYVPSRTEVKPGTKGSVEFVQAYSPYGEILEA